MNDSSKHGWRPDRLAYWYFRLNGFLTTENFVIHPDSGADQRTDADLLAVRFFERLENFSRPMNDDPRVTSCATFGNVVIAEVKKGQCALNGPWTDPNTGNMRRVINAIGCVPKDSVGNACQALHEKGIWRNASVTIRLFALGEWRVENLPIPQHQQLTWDEVIEFCIRRFRTYQREKSSVGQWTDDGQRLRALSLSANGAAIIRRSFGLREKELNQL
jgi:hypothetical protein